MTVYADVLILLNMIVDYLILSLTSYVLDIQIKTMRLVLSAFLGALFSLLIFLPDFGPICELLTVVLSAGVITLICFGFKSLKRWVKCFCAFFTVNIIYNGLMTAVWVLFKPEGMLINNSITYFSISPFEFIVSTVLFYLLIRVVQSFLKRTAPFAKRCRIRLINNGKSLELSALVDTGNSLSDPFTGKQVIIVGRKTAELIIEDIENSPRFLLPVRSINGNGIISAYSCETAVIDNKKTIPVLVAVTDKEFDDEYKAIVNPAILN